MNIYFRTLGCEKNTVDSEYAAGLLSGKGHTIVDEPELADVIIVNTCGFINDAKEQSIEAILSLGNSKKPGQRLYVSGCLAQRYGKELSKSIPEADGFLGVNDYDKLPDIVAGEKQQSRLNLSKSGDLYEEFSGRLRQGPSWTAPIKIAEGCNNICTYCSIPFIRGRYRSRRADDVVNEAMALAKDGVKELVVIAQDVTGYGRDFGESDALPALLKRLCAIDGIEWIRLMYCYEDEITQGLIDVVRDEPKICKYMDIPIQHCSDSILKAMNRRSTGESIRSTINVLRKQIPDIVIRTTLISGFPGETKEDFDELLEFVRVTRFDRLGVFAYSKEDGTAAAKMKNQVRKDTKERRRDKIMAAQREISLENNMKLVGRRLKVLVEECQGDGENTYIGRTEMDAPDIDNSVIFTSDKPIELGSFVWVNIEDAFDYDISGTICEEN